MRHGALGHLALGRGEGLAHLGRQDPGDVGLLALEQVGGALEQDRTLPVAGAAVLDEGLVRPPDQGIDLVGGVLVIALEHLPAGWIHRCEGHGTILTRRSRNHAPAPIRDDPGPVRARPGAHAIMRR